jgi:hypothetical protein
MKARTRSAVACGLRANGDEIARRPRQGLRRDRRSGPHLVGNPPTVQIELPPRMTLALAADDTGFATLAPFEFVSALLPGPEAKGVWRYPYDGRQAPFAVIADFDGDERDEASRSSSD